MGNVCGKKSDVQEKQHNKQFEKVQPTQHQNPPRNNDSLQIQKNKGVNMNNDDSTLVKTNGSNTQRTGSLNTNDKQNINKNAFLKPQNPEFQGRDISYPQGGGDISLRKTGRPIQMPAIKSSNQDRLLVKY